MSRNIYLDDQGGGVMNILKDDVSSCLLLNGAKAHALIVCERKPQVIAFAQTTRNDAGCVSAESGTNLTTYLCLPERRNVPHRTPKCNKITKGKVICANPKMGIETWENCSCTILAPSYKEPPIIFGA